MQVAFADTVLLNKADRIDDKQMQVVRSKQLERDLSVGYRR